MSLQRRLKFALLALLGILIIGAVGYHVIEKWDIVDSIYMVVIGLTTVGFGEVHPLSPTGRLFTIVIILLGMGLLLYTVSTGVTFLVEGELRGLLRRRKMDKEISKLRNHYIICGAKGAVEHTIGEFIKTKRKFVVIEENKEIADKLMERNILVINGNPSEEEVLLRAGIEHARGLISGLESDKDNLFVVITARQLNPKIRIVTRAYSFESVSKLRRAGANSVVSTEFISGLRIASEMLRPAVVTFLDEMLHREIPLRLEEIAVPENSPYVDSALKDIQIPQKTGLIVLAIKDGITGEYIYNPAGERKVKPNDVLIVIGTPEQREKLVSVLGGT